MNVILLNIDSNNLNFASVLNRTDEFVICDLSFSKEYSSHVGELSYFNFCKLFLKKSLQATIGTDKDLLISGFDFEKLLDHKYEVLYLFSLICPLDPIIIGKKPVLLETLFGISFNRFVPFDSKVNFSIDLEEGIKNAKMMKKEVISDVVSVFSAFGLILSFGPSFSDIVRIKENTGLPISYDEFVDIFENKRKTCGLDSSQFFKDISKYALIREHNPVDLFIQKNKTKK